MTRNRDLTLGALVAVGVLAAALGVAWRWAAAQEGEQAPAGRVVEGRPAGAAAPVPGGPGFYSVSAVAFRPLDPTYGWKYHNDQELYNPGADWAEYSAPLSLPNGATVTKFVVYYYDDCDGGTAGNLFASLTRNNSDGTGWHSMAAFYSSGATPRYQYGEDTTIYAPVVDQQSYAYTAEVSLDGGCGLNLSLLNVRVDYAFPVSLPQVTKDWQSGPGD